jgi:hypothetical protein
MNKLKVNHLQILLELLPNKEWSNISLLENPNIFIINEKQSIEFFDKTLKSKDCYRWLPTNPNMTWEYRNSHSIDPDYGSIEWGYNSFSSNPNITWDIVYANPQFHWNYKSLAKNPKITWDIIQENPTDVNGVKIYWNYQRISMNPNITWLNVKSKLHAGWDWDQLSMNPNITWEIIQENQDKDIYWNSSFVVNPNLTWEIVQQNPNPKFGKMCSGWDYRMLSWNINITWDIISANPDGGFSSGKKCVWDYKELSGNPNITWEIIQQNPHGANSSEKKFVWDYRSLSMNPNITWRNVYENLDKPWDFGSLSSNLFNKDSIVCKRLLCEKYFKKWRNFVERERKVRQFWQTEFSASIDLLKLRAADINLRNFENKSPKFIF